VALWAATNGANILALFGATRESTASASRNANNTMSENWRRDYGDIATRRTHRHLPRHDVPLLAALAATPSSFSLYLDSSPPCRTPLNKQISSMAFASCA